MLLNQFPKPFIIAHRGASKIAPENTLPAFEAAIVQGADAVELDVMLTADREMVVCHDAALGRTIDGEGSVGKKTLAELREMDAGVHFSPEFAGVKVPTLEEVLVQIAPRMPINIELKNLAAPFDDLPERVAELLKRTGSQDRVWMSSFNPIALRRFRKAMPAVPVGLLWFDPGKRLWYGMQRGTHAEAIHPEKSSITPAFVQQVHAAGQIVCPYTVDDPEQMKQFFAWGVDAIITNVPQVASEVRG